MPRRTVQRSILKLKELIFDRFGMQDVVELRRRRQLEDSMGFRGQWEDHREFQIDLLKKQGMLPSSRLLEIGCGPMTGGIPIIRYLNAGCYTGVDVRDSVLNLAWQEVGDAGLSKKNARLICSSNFAQPELAAEKFDFILSFSVLFHLDDEVLDKFFHAVSQVLSPEGRCITNINTEVPDSTWLEFPFKRRSVEQYRSAAARYKLNTRDFGEITSLGFSGNGLEKHNRLLVFQRA